jgi:hypothetical protein
MVLALESTEGDIARAIKLVSDLDDPLASRDLALQLLGRAHRRVETVRVALGTTVEPSNAKEVP